MTMPPVFLIILRTLPGTVHTALYTLYVPVRHVPVVVIESPRAAVGEHDRGGGGRDGVHHGLAGHVGDVDLECS